MNTENSSPQPDQPASPPARRSQRQRQFCLLAVLSLVLAFARPASAGLLSTTVEGPANAPYSYNLTIQFLNNDYYNFILRSNQSTITGYDLLNTVASLTPGMTVNQVGPSSFGYYVNGITIGADNNPGYDSATRNYWTYWNGTATNPVQWTFAPNGESSTMLTPGQADGWVYNTGSTQPTATTFAVPEPDTSTWIGLALMALFLFGRVRLRRVGSRIET